MGCEEGLNGRDRLDIVPTGKSLFRYSHSRHHPPTRGQIGPRSEGVAKLRISGISRRARVV
jgi:hypothetical protein